MQVILMERVINLGNLGDVVKVKARLCAQLSYSPRQGQARHAGEHGGVRSSAAPNSKRRRQRKLVEAQELAAKLEGMSVQIARKAGVDGRLFGSVTNFDIADALAAQGVALERSTVRLPDGPLKQVGDAQIQVVLHTDVTATITVTVKGEL